MPLSESSIIDLVKSQTDASGNPDDSDASIKLWIADAVGAIQRRRGETTEKTADIELVTNQTAYDLPDDCVTVTAVLFTHDSSGGQNLGVPNPAPFAAVGLLPSGQTIDVSTDAIVRQRRALEERKEAWRVRGGKLQIECPFSGDETVRVEYDSDDREVANVPARYAQNVVDYVRMMMIRTKLDKLATVPVMTGDGLESRPIMSMRMISKDLQDRWEDFLSGTFPEAA